MDNIEQTLKQYFGYDTFLAGQREIIDQAVAGRDAFVLMPTGAGKSLTYQFSALMLPGLTIVISPLIALMHDQVDRLKTNDIAATFVNSSLSTSERSQREQAALDGKLKKAAPLAGVALYTPTPRAVQALPTPLSFRTWFPFRECSCR